MHEGGLRGLRYGIHRDADDRLDVAVGDEEVGVRTPEHDDARGLVPLELVDEPDQGAEQLAAEQIHRGRVDRGPGDTRVAFDPDALAHRSLPAAPDRSERMSRIAAVRTDARV